MTVRLLVTTSVAASLALAVACGQTGSPVSPSVSPAGVGAVADGSTLKATAPAPIFPVGGIRLDTLEPVFRLGTSSARYTSASFTYRLQLQGASGQAVAEVGGLTPVNGENEWEIPFLLELDTAYRWRGRAEIGQDFGPWSDFATFLSLDYRGIVPRPPDGAWPTDGQAVLDYIAASFPEYLVTTATTAERLENMEFIRDRVIEAGVCGGLDLARNLKRGIGPHSIDAIAWRLPDGDVEVVDIASAFDDKTIPLRLVWQIVEGPSGYDPLPDHPGC